MSTAVHLLTERSQDLGAHPEIDGNFPLGDAVLEALPDGTRVLSANKFGSSAWTETAHLKTVSDDETPKSYFLKCAAEDVGKGMMEGEYNAMCELYKTAPSMVPKPYTWGKFQLQGVDFYFFLCDFVDMRNQLPDPIQLGRRLADFHRASVSPTGKFGFGISTYHGKFPQYVDWDSNWASFFTKLLADALRLDKQNNDPWPELERVSERTLTKVIPRLLGILQEDGREIRPCLIHGDLWEGNIGVSCDTGEILIFDAGAYYAHNEMEIGMWRCTRHKINARTFTKQYLKFFPPTEPKEEWEDRNRIYCVKMNIVHSAHHKGDIVRQTAFEDMCYLVDKYAPWDSDVTAGSKA